MLTPLDKVLIKIFAKGFFRINSGLLLFLFVVLISYCFFIETVGHVSLLSPEQLTFYHFIIVRTFISSPLVTFIIFLFWLVYAIKSWRYVLRQFLIPSHQFLFYSFTSLSRLQQLKSWLYVQSAIFLPIIVYGIFASTVGIIFQQYILPGIILIYILTLTVVSAGIYTISLNRLLDGVEQTFISRVTKSWQKPYFSLFIFHVFDRVKLGYLLAQVLSYLSIVLASILGVQYNLRLAGIVILLVATAHSFIIYQNYLFEETHLGFSRNLPYSYSKRFIYLACVYLLLLLPEYIWLFTKFDWVVAVKSLLLGLSMSLLFHCILYWLGPHMNKYIRIIFFLFSVTLIIIMFDGTDVLVPINLLGSFILFYKHYYTSYTSV